MADTQESETPTVAEQGEAVEETAAVTETTADTATGEQPEEPGDVQESQEKDAAPEEVQGQQTEQEGEKQAEGDAAPEQEEAAPQAAEGESKEEEATPTVEGEATPTVEGEATPTVEGEATGEAAAPAEGEGGEAPEGQTTGEEGEKPQTPAAAEGEQPVEGEAQKQEGEVPEGEGGEGAAVKEGGEEGEGAKETEEGKEGGDGGAESQTEGEQTPGEGQGEAAGEEKTEGATETGQEGEGEVKESDGEQTETPRGEDESKSPMPQSDTFGEGERPESSLGVGEKLSREPTPTGDQGETIQTDMLAPTTPERLASPEMGEQAHWTVHEEDEQPEFDREQLIEKYHAALTQREQLQSQNYQLQHKLAEYFRKKKADERQEYDKNVTDQEQRYLKYMAQLEDLRRQDQHERETSRLQIDELKDRCQDKKDKVDGERNKFMEFRKQVAINAINGRSGKPIPEKDIEQYLTSAMRKETEVVQVRLENIKLKNKLKKKEQQLKSKEELAEGLHLIDFEQLKIENQTYNEKIEERNEELLKLRKKITSTVQVLTHLKEKLQFVYAENHDQKGNLKEVEFHVAQRRDILSRTKQARDSLRIDNQRLRQNCGLLGNESLLRDFEERKDESDDLKDQLESLKMQHAELTLNCNQVRRKIEQARTGRQ